MIFLNFHSLKAGSVSCPGDKLVVPDLTTRYCEYCWWYLFKPTFMEDKNQSRLQWLMTSWWQEHCTSMSGILIYHAGSLNPPSGRLNAMSIDAMVTITIVITWKRFLSYFLIGSPSQTARTIHIWCFFVVSLMKLLNKQWWCSRFETPWHSRDIPIMTKSMH